MIYNDHNHDRFNEDEVYYGSETLVSKSSIRKYVEEWLTVDEDPQLIAYNIMAEFEKKTIPRIL